MNLANYTWTGNSPLEQRYPALKAITGVVVEKPLVEYDLLVSPRPIIKAVEALVLVLKIGFRGWVC